MYTRNRNCQLLKGITKDIFTEGISFVKPC